MRNVSMLAALFLVLGACDEPAVMPELNEASQPGAPLAAQGRPDRVPVCHYNGGTDSWALMNLVDAAAERHLTTHDRDGQPGDVVPGTSWFLFGESCELVPIEECPCYDPDVLRSHMADLEDLTYHHHPIVDAAVFDGGDWTAKQFWAYVEFVAPTCIIEDTRPEHAVSIHQQVSSLQMQVCFHYIVDACREFRCDGFHPRRN